MAAGPWRCCWADRAWRCWPGRRCGRRHPAPIRPLRGLVFLDRRLRLGRGHGLPEALARAGRPRRRHGLAIVDRGAVRAGGMLLAGESFPLQGWSVRVAGALIFHIVLGTAAAYWLWFVLSERISATTASLTAGGAGGGVRALVRATGRPPRTGGFRAGAGGRGADGVGIGRRRAAPEQAWGGCPRGRARAPGAQFLAQQRRAADQQDAAQHQQRAARRRRPAVHPGSARRTTRRTAAS